MVSELGKQIYSDILRINITQHIKSKFRNRIRDEAVNYNKTRLYRKKHSAAMVMSEKATKWLFCSNLQMQ